MSTPVQQPRLPERAFPGQAFPQCNVAGPQQPQTYPSVAGQPGMYGPPTAQAGGAEETDLGTCAPPTMRAEPQATGPPADRPVTQTPEMPSQVPTRQPDPRYVAPELVPPQAQYRVWQQAPPAFCQQPMPPIPQSLKYRPPSPRHRTDQRLASQVLRRSPRRIHFRQSVMGPRTQPKGPIGISTAIRIRASQ